MINWPIFFASLFFTLFVLSLFFRMTVIKHNHSMPHTKHSDSFDDGFAQITEEDFEPFTKEEVVQLFMELDIKSRKDPESLMRLHKRNKHFAKFVSKYAANHVLKMMNRISHE